jgi:16S rRNA (uracil1498-N3)-methyltransferase
MSVPFFYVSAIESQGAFQTLTEDASRHIVQVLRMVNGERLRLTDGKGTIAETEISDDHKKKCVVQIREIFLQERPAARHTIAISLLKNNTRFEWFLEKATELGISQIIPLICSRTEKQHFRSDRMQSIVISAMLQSQQSWLTELTSPMAFTSFVDQYLSRNETSNGYRTFIAHCEEGQKKSLLSQEFINIHRKMILIGPEGDFTREEIQLATGHKSIPIELGATRLRTETAGVIAATLAQLCK